MEDGRPFFQEAVERDASAVAKHLARPELREHLDALREAFVAAQPFDGPTLEATLRTLADRRGIKAAQLIHATRVAVTGRAASPGLFEVLELLGRERTAARMQEAIASIG